MICISIKGSVPVWSYTQRFSMATVNVAILNNVHSNQAGATPHLTIDYRPKSTDYMAGIGRGCCLVRIKPAVELALLIILDTPLQ